MYAIQTGTKFIKPSSSYRSFYDIVVTETPKFVKSQQEALAHKKAIIEQLDKSITAFEKQMAEEGAKVAKELARIPKLEAKLEALKELPYKEVYKKIPRAERELSDALWYKRANSVSTWKRDIARLQRIKEGNIRVVKMQQTLVDA
jgi:uncharacterized protein YicC (UPF0701 family)